jgi:HAMP domain-containing protein/HPt (histidine-containing phosphotransfer) domain-containing protein
VSVTDPVHNAPARPRPTKSLRNKFIQTLLLVATIIGVSTLTIVGVMSAQASAQHLSAVQKYIEEGITSKGRVLTRNHALALRSLTVDNAFLDMQRLVERAIQDDDDLVYGIYVSAERDTLALARRPLVASTSLPERDAWRSLGLRDPEINVKSAAVARVHRFGQDLLEVAAPVVGEDGELLGTVRYGLSTKRMQDALLSAQADSAARLKRSFMWIGLLVGLSVVVGLLLSRRQAVRMTRPISDLTLAAQTLAAGNLGVRVNITSQDELELLGASFNRMVEDLATSYGHLEEMNHTLEQKVSARTLELAHKNRDMRLVLDNVDEGFITLSPTGVMALERSRQVETWFGEAERSVTFWQYLSRTSDSFAMSFELGWSQILDGFLPLCVCLAQLPERLEHEGRTWSLRYLPIQRDDDMEGVLVAISEITERLARERDDTAHAELMQAFKHLLRDRAGFEVFFRESSELASSICGRKLDADDVLHKRALHTLKGTCASMGLNGISEICHELESELAETGRLSDGLLATLGSRWQGMTDHLVSSGALQSQPSVEIPERDYAELVSLAVDSSVTRPELHKRLSAWQGEPVERAFRGLAEQAVALSRRMGKGDLRVAIDAGGVRFDRDKFGSFFGELVHVLRNAFDHGIEAPAERASRGKPAVGTLNLRATRRGDELEFQIGDDGAGIDWERIRSMAKSRGLPHESQADLLSALCADGVTTRAEVTALSGRGVGMAAFKQRVLALGGSLDVRSVRGEGTTWLVRFSTASAVHGARDGGGAARSSPGLVAGSRGS